MILNSAVSRLLTIHIPRIFPSSLSRLPSCSTSLQIRPLFPSKPFSIMAPKKSDSNGNGDEEMHQQQSGNRTDRKEDEWKHREPYKIHGDDEGFDVKWKGKCHCGKVQYQLSREKPLASKFCHCTTCQRLHGVSTSVRRAIGLTDYLAGSISVGNDLPKNRHQFHSRTS
jgi:hypothetical protein